MMVQMKMETQRENFLFHFHFRHLVEKIDLLCNKVELTSESVIECTLTVSMEVFSFYFPFCVMSKYIFDEIICICSISTFTRQHCSVLYKILPFVLAVSGERILRSQLMRKNGSRNVISKWFAFVGFNIFYHKVCQNVEIVAVWMCLWLWLCVGCESVVVFLSLALFRFAFVTLYGYSYNEFSVQQQFSFRTQFINCVTFFGWRSI